MRFQRNTISRWTTRLALASLLLLLPGCNSKPAEGEPQPSEAVTTSESEPSDAAVDDTLPVLGMIGELKLTDQDGQAYDLDQLDHRVSIVNFFFTTCTSTCPIQTRELAKLQTEFADLKPVQILSISVNPEVDTPEILTSYANSNGADTARWSFLTGNRNVIWELSKQQFMLPVGESPENQGMPIFHSPKFVLLDGQRQIRGFFESSSDREIGKLRTAVRQLASETIASPEPEAQTDTDAPRGPSISDLIVDSSDPPSTSQLEESLDPQEFREVARTPRDAFVPQRKPDWLARRAAEQKAQSEQFKVLHDFAFQDRQPESGITWEATVVEDASRQYVAAHYDHGNGIAVADVDGDGRVDMYLTSQLGANALLRNLGDGKFEDVAAQAGVALAEHIGVTASFADYDNDGDPDLFVTNVRTGNVLFRNDGDWKFTDVTAEAGVDYVGHSSAAVFFDFDKDGLLDLFVTNVGNYTIDEKGPGGYYRSFNQAFSGHLRPDLTETSILYKNLDGTRFKDVTEEMNLIDDSWSGAATPFDANGDGWIDIYTCDMQGHDEYFENLQGKGFAKKSREVFPNTPWGAMGVKVFDFDNDGQMELYITDMHSDMSEHVGIEKEKLKANMRWPESMVRSGGQSIWGNALFRKQADGTYADVSDALGAENYWPWGLSIDDLNADGWQDAFIASSMNFPLRYGVNSVLLNENGSKFVDAEFVLGVEPRRDNVCSKPWFTIDGDKEEDRELRYAKKLGITSGLVTVWSALGSRSSVIFDLDNDGDLDIVTNDFNSPPLVLISDLAQRHKINYLKINLVGTTSNKDGLGSTVQVTTSEGEQTKIHDGQSGYLSQSSKELYFGLGQADKVERVTVTWPTGKQQTVLGPEPNSKLTIEER